VTDVRILALSCVLAFAGCVQPPSEPGAPSAPAWNVGDWWTYHFTAGQYGRQANVTLVVGAANASGYVMGMPEDDYQLDAILFHVPPAGGVAANLSWSVHDALFEPFRFPLADGLSWETHWATTPVKLTARAAKVTTPSGETDGYRIVNEVGDTNRKFEYTYAEKGAHWFVEYQRAYADGRVLERMELVEHGHGYHGKVRLLDGVTIVLLESRSDVLLKGGAPAPPTVSFSVPAGVDTLMTACVVGGAPGTYRATITAADGRAACDASLTVAPGDARSLSTPAEVRQARGSFEARLAAAGQGSATAEVLGYRSWTVDL
jgi:hypothetical protein